VSHVLNDGRRTFYYSNLYTTKFKGLRSYLKGLTCNTIMRPITGCAGDRVEAIGVLSLCQCIASAGADAVEQTMPTKGFFFQTV